MSLNGVYDLLLRGLAGEADPNSLQYISPDEAHADLRRRTGRDFGFNVEKWRDFLAASREALGVGKFEQFGRRDGPSSIPPSMDEPAPSRSRRKVAGLQKKDEGLKKVQKERGTRLKGTMTGRGNKSNKKRTRNKKSTGLD
jgi:hypothetical protein